MAVIKINKNDKMSAIIFDSFIIFSPVIKNIYIALFI